MQWSKRQREKAGICKRGMISKKSKRLFFYLGQRRMTKKILTGLLLIVFMLNMAGCATLPPQSVPTFQKISPQVRQKNLSALTNWAITGEMSIEDKTQAVMVDYQWQQKGLDYQIHLNSPMNFVSAKIIGKRGGAVQLWRSKTQVFTAISPEVLLEQQLGWRVPISYLFYWIRGIPAPARPLNHLQTKYDDSGHLIFLDQQNWQVNFSDYISIGKVDLPKQIDLNYPSLHVRIVINKWSTPILPQETRQTNHH